MAKKSKSLKKGKKIQHTKTTILSTVQDKIPVTA